MTNLIIILIATFMILETFLVIILFLALYLNKRCPPRTTNKMYSNKTEKLKAGQGTSL